MMNVQSLTFRRLNAKDGVALKTAISQWDNDPNFQFVREFSEQAGFEAYLKLLETRERGENIPANFVPETSLFAFLGDTIVGRVSLRHQLNDFLFRVGGHIGYGVLPQFRRRGYGLYLLQQTLPVAQMLGLERVLVTCNDDNHPSARIIETCGGILENVVEVEAGKPLKRRYWIGLK